MITLYYTSEATSLRTLWLLRELDVPFRMMEMKFGSQGERPDQDPSIRSLGRVPSLVDGDVRLLESGAVVQYLCERFPAKGLGRELGHPERYTWLQWVHYAETITAHTAATQARRSPFFPAAQRSAVMQKLEQIRFESVIYPVEMQLRDRDYLLASGFSAADICIACSIRQAEPFIDLPRFTRVSQHYARVAARPAATRLNMAPIRHGIGPEMRSPPV